MGRFGALWIAMAGACTGPAESVPLLAEAGLCEPEGEAGVEPGTDLERLTLAAPDALCNDGTPAVAYVRAAPTDSPDADKWVIFLEQGGGCGTYDGCRSRWCGGADRMSADWTPEGMSGSGVFHIGGNNAFRGYNLVFVDYCSSDSWSGTQAAVFEAPDRPSYRMLFHGYHILNAVVDELKVGAISDQGFQAMPELDAASMVVLAGSSAGSAGVMRNLDRIAERLRTTNPTVEVRGVLDAAVSPFEADPPAVSAEEVAARDAVTSDVFYDERGSIPDASCTERHGEDRDACFPVQHSLLDHITTPVFLRQDLRDENASPWLYPDAASYTAASRALVRRVADLADTAEERALLAVAPTVFAPTCGSHTSLMSSRFYTVELAQGKASVSFHDALRDWIDDPSPRVLIDDPSTGVTSVCP